MSNFDIIILAFKNILRNKVKFVLTSLSICIGISSVMIITTVGDIGKNEIDAQLDAMGIDGLSVFENDDVKILNIDFINDIKAKFDVEYVMPVVMTYGYLQSNRLSKNMVVWGVDETLYDTLRVNDLHGRSITSSDVKFEKNVVIVDDVFANELYQRTDIVGKTIEISINGQSRDFEIIGVISNQKAMLDTFFGENSPSFVYIPYTTCQSIKNTDEFTQLAIRSSADLDELQSDMEYYFSKKSEYADNLYIQNISSYMDGVSQIAVYVTYILAFVASISMIVAGIGVLNVMLSSTIERKKEIGIYMALGATNTQIGKIFLMESIMICLFSGILGAIIGLIVVFLIANFIGLEFVINYRYILIVEIISFICGVLAGIIPAIKASKLNPIDVLRE